MKKKKRGLKRWVKVLILCAITSAFSINCLKSDKIMAEKASKVDKNVEKVPESSQKVAQNEEKVEEIEIIPEIEPVEPKIEEDVAVEPKIHTFRMTSYYPYESSNCTGSGKCTWDFQVNDKGWYMYDGKIVLAAATTYLQKSYGIIENRHYFKYYDEIDITIDGATYKGIILDSCGACMKVTHEERVDLFVSDSEYVMDRGYLGNNPVSISY